MPLIIHDKLNLILHSYLREMTDYYQAQIQYHTSTPQDAQSKELAEQAYADAMSDAELYDLLHEKNHHFDLANAILQIKRNREAYLQHERFDFLVEAIDRMEEEMHRYEAISRSHESKTP